VTPDVRSAPADARQLVPIVLRLALGAPRRGDGEADWPAVYEAASRELLAVLAWHRAGRFIRLHANPETAATWRRAALAAEVRGDRQLALLGEVTRMLAAFDVDPVVLKGLPLGARLYGDPFVRCSADIDLFVPADQRSRASATLEAAGWERTEGAAPWHESWSAIRAGVEYHLELHSLLVSDHLAHVNAPAALARRVRIGHVDVEALDGDFVAPYLAVHLATHQLPPLLWLVDFATFWSSLSADERQRAEESAAAARVSGYLDWARRRAAHVARAADGDLDALGALGIRADGRHDMHSIWRHLALAESTADRLRVFGAFLLPHRVRHDARSIVSYTMARLRTRVRTLAGTTRSYDARAGTARRVGAGKRPPGARALRLDRDDLVALTGEVVAAGGALRVRVSGGSMRPTVPRGALVRIGPVPTDGIDVGDVALALTADGEPVLHRVLALTDDGIVMRGDAAIISDAPIPFARIIGVATHVVENGRDVPIGRRPKHSLAVSALKVRRRIERMVRRAH
jgi:hypothetical protein